jgi:hypothetical protein
MHKAKPRCNSAWLPILFAARRTSHRYPPGARLAKLLSCFSSPTIGANRLAQLGQGVSTPLKRVGHHNLDVAAALLGCVIAGHSEVHVLGIDIAHLLRDRREESVTTEAVHVFRPCLAECQLRGLLCTLGTAVKIDGASCFSGLADTGEERVDRGSRGTATAATRCAANS